MTDLDKWKQFLSSFGVGFEEEAPIHGIISLTLTATENTRVEGYIGFTLSISFNIDGSFIELVISE